MPRDLSALKQPLTPSIGMESVDTRLGAMADLAEEGDFDTLGDQVEELLGQGIFDIRAISYLLFDSFLESGFVALGEVLLVLKIACSTNYEAIGPVAKRAVNFDRRYTWLFEKLSQNMDYHELKRTPEWAAWHHGSTPETFDTLLEVAGELATAVDGASLKEAGRALGHLSQRLRGRRDSLRAATEKPKARGPRATAVAAPTAAEGTPEAQPASNGASASSGWILPTGGLGMPRQRVDLTVSLQFVELCAKLHAFEVLVQKQQFEKAAVVCEDLVQTLDQFDPRTYFPELFGPYGALFSKHALVLSEMWERRESPVWKAMSQYYRTDLKSFVES